MNFINRDEKLQLKIKFNRARYMLMFMIILSAINIITVSYNGVASMPFSSAISTFSVAYGIYLRDNSIFYTLGYAIAVITLLTLLVCYLKSKKNILFLVFALGLIVVDSLVLIIMAYNSINALVMIDLIVHVMTVYYFTNGIKAHKRLFKLENNIDSPYEENPENEVEAIKEDFLDDEDIDNEIDVPLGKYVDDGTIPLVKGEFAGLKIFVVIRNNRAELVVNKNVCDALDVSELDEFQLRVIVNDIDIIFDYKRIGSGDTMYLYADDELIDSLGRR